MEIEFLDGANAGQVLDVPRKRLRVAWAEADAYDQLMANWARLSEYELTDTESNAVEHVFQLLIPAEAAAWLWSHVRFACAIRDLQALETITHRDTTALLEGVETFEHENTLWTSPEGTARVAEAATRANPARVLAWVHEHERECRVLAKRGGGVSGEATDDSTTPAWEYEQYLVHHRPLHELLRQWCGHRSVTFHERLLAAEQEIHRLDELLARVLDALRESGGGAAAGFLEQEHESERITPHNVRPAVVRPLPPEYHERVVYRRGWW